MSPPPFPSLPGPAAVTTTVIVAAAAAAGGAGREGGGIQSGIPRCLPGHFFLSRGAGNAREEGGGRRKFSFVRTPSSSIRRRFQHVEREEEEEEEGHKKYGRRIFLPSFLSLLDPPCVRHVFILRI